MLPSKEVSKDPLLLEVLEHVRRLETRLEDMQKQLQALPAPQEASQAEYVARLEQLYAEADKRAQYAMDELKRRDEAVARKRRPDLGFVTLTLQRLEPHARVSSCEHRPLQAPSLPS
jgi:hypothetical protein